MRRNGVGVLCYGFKMGGAVGHPVANFISTARVLPMPSETVLYADPVLSQR